MSLTKDDIVKALVKETGCQLNQSVEMIETLLELIKFTLASGEDVLISGFGKFCVNEKRQRRGQESGNRRGYDAGCKAGGDLQMFGAAKEKDKQRVDDTKFFSVTAPQVLRKPRPSQCNLYSAHQQEPSPKPSVES